MLTLFEALLITHFIMDWIFQTSWEAMNKAKSKILLLIHCLVYTIGFIFAFCIYEMNFLWLILIFISHFFLDNRKFEIWLLEKFKGFKKETTPEPLYWILLIGVDQTLHFAILAIITIFTY